MEYQEKQRMLKKDVLPDDPFEIAVKLIGDEWKILLIGRLMFKDKDFDQLYGEIKGISRNTLRQSLQELEISGLVRTEQDSLETRVIFAVTPLGASVAPILEAMREWGENYRSLVQIMDDE